MKLWSRFKSNCSGGTAIMFAMALLPLALGAGVAIDMVQTNRTITKLQSAVDAAVLAAATSGKTDVAGLKSEVTKYLKANGAMDILAVVDSIEPTFDKSKRTFSVRLVGKRNTSLMHLAGISSTKLDVYAATVLGGDGLEVALVLDNTLSMATSGRMAALKVAAADLVDDLMDMSASGTYVRAGIVPFAQYVNVGLSRRNESWLNVVPDSSTTTEQCSTVYDNPPTKKNCKMIPYMVDGVDQGTLTESCEYEYTGTFKNICADVTNVVTWSGCVGSRVQPLDENIGSMTNRYPGMSNTSCVSELVDLTDNRSDLQASISGLVTVGETYIAQGLLWGWNMLDSAAPLTSAKTTKAMKAMGGTKTLILMTDGANTLASDAPYHWSSSDGVYAARGDKKMEVLCKNIKKDGIVIYTVSFMITDAAAAARVKACATDSSKAFNADNAAQLSEAFENIGASLTALRLTK